MRHSRSLIAVAILTAALPLYAQSASSPPPVRQTQAVTLARAALAALGPGAALNSVSLTGSGSWLNHGSTQSGAVRLEALGPWRSLVVLGGTDDETPRHIIRF